MSDAQYVHDAGYSEIRTKVRESISGTRGSLKGVQGPVSLIVRAALLTCGVAPFGERLVRIVGALPRSR
jgi:hypothetical protein